jgi:hypothetical protein
MSTEKHGGMISIGEKFLSRPPELSAHLQAESSSSKAGESGEKV